MRKAMGIVILVVLILLSSQELPAQTTVSSYTYLVNKGDKYEWRVNQFEYNQTQLCNADNHCETNNFGFFNTGDTLELDIMKDFDQPIPYFEAPFPLFTNESDYVYPEYYTFYQNGESINVSACFFDIFTIMMSYVSDTSGSFWYTDFIVPRLNLNNGSSTLSGPPTFTNSTMFGSNFTFGLTSSVMVYRLETGVLQYEYLRSPQFELEISIISEHHLQKQTTKSFPVGNPWFVTGIWGILIVESFKEKKIRYE